MRQLTIRAHSVLTMINSQKLSCVAMTAPNSSVVLVVPITIHNLLFKAHTVLDRTQIDDWQVQQTVPSYMCEEHHGKELDMFCHEHDQLCCYVCVSTKHR